MDRSNWTQSSAPCWNWRDSPRHRHRSPRVPWAWCGCSPKPAACTDRGPAGHQSPPPAALLVTRRVLLTSGMHQGCATAHCTSHPEDGQVDGQLGLSASLADRQTAIYLVFLAPPAGIEPATCGLGNRRSEQTFAQLRTPSRVVGARLIPQPSQRCRSLAVTSVRVDRR